jgi:hypothetical protein
VKTYEKCLIVKHVLGRRSWYLVQQGRLTLSTPLDTFDQATEWIKSMVGVQRVGCYRITDDLTEVHYET